MPHNIELMVVIVYVSDIIFIKINKSTWVIRLKQAVYIDQNARLLSFSVIKSD